MTATMMVVAPARGATPEPVRQALPSVRVPVPAIDVAFDATNEVLWASSPAAAGAPYGNSVVPIDPASGAVGTPVFVGSDPGEIEISADGSYLYVALEGAQAIRRVNLASRSADVQIPIGSRIMDIDVMPGRPETIAVVDDNDHVTIYDGTVARPTVAFQPGEVVFDPQDPSRLYGYMSYSTGFELYRMTVSPVGVLIEDATPDLLSGFTVDLQMSNGMLTNGNEVIDPVSRTVVAPTLRGYAHVPFVFDGVAMRHWTVRAETAPYPSPRVDLQLWDSRSQRMIDAFWLDTGPQPLPSYRLAALAATGPQRLAVVVQGALLLVDTGRVRGASGEYTSLTPARVLDTRAGVGASGPLGPGGTARVQIAGRGGVPDSGVAAVVLNATAVDPTAPTYLTIWPSGGPRPEISSLNLAPGVTRANLVTVALGAGGSLDVYNFDGQVHALFDVVGYYATADGTPGSRYRAVAPLRAFDTRTGLGGVPASPVGPGQTLQFRVPGVAGLPTTGVRAVVLNVTATDATEPSYLTVWPDDAARPDASTVNFAAGRAVPNLAIVRVPPSGVVSFYNALGSAHVIADVFGYYTTDVLDEGGRFVPFAPTRALDTRITRQSTCCDVYVKGLPDDPADVQRSYAAYVLNIAVTDVRGDGYVTAHPSGQPRPVVSNVNFVNGESVANAAIVPTGPWIELEKSAGLLQYVVDVFGAFTTGMAAA